MGRHHIGRSSRGRCLIRRGTSDAVSFEPGHAPLNDLAKSSDAVAAPIRSRGVAEAVLVVDCGLALIHEIDAAAQRTLGLSVRDAPLSLDAAMPALQALRRLAEGKSLTGESILAFWTPSGTRSVRCRYRRPCARGTGSTRFTLKFPSHVPLAPPEHKAPIPATTAAGEVRNVSIEAIKRLAHELRAPVSAIFSAADVLAEGYLGAVEDERHQSYVVGIRDTARHILGVVESMLLAPAAAIGQGSAAPSSVDIGAALCEVAHGLVALATSAGVELTADPALKSSVITVDHTILRQMIYNLLSNAIRHAGSGASVVARTGRAAGGDVWLEVEDDGPGVPQTIIERTFDDAAYADVESGIGAGLGLLLTRKLAEAAGAELMIDSDASGTRARITFRRTKRR